MGPAGSNPNADPPIAARCCKTDDPTHRKIAKALIEREVLDANEIKMLVEGRELPPIQPPPSKPEDVPHVIKPELQPGRAKGGERPATA